MSLSERETKVCRLIEQRRTALLDDLRLHVGLPTGMNNTAALDETRDRLTLRLRALGASYELTPGAPKPDWLDAWRPSSASTSIPPTAVCRRIPPSPGVGQGAILLSGHLDTVHDPAGPFRELSIASGARSGDRAHQGTATGPGCVDMKGGLVIALAALEALEEAGERLDWGFILNSDEETGSYHSDAALRAEASSNRYRCALALEPAMARGELAIERGGSGQFLLDARGTAAHVGRDFWAGASAVHLLADAIARAAAISDQARAVAVNVGPIHSAEPPNVVADRARAWGNFRFASQADGAAVAASLRTLERNDPKSGLSVLTSINRPAKPRTQEVDALAAVARAAAEDLGQSLPFARSGGVCDGNNLQAAGLPTIDTLGVRGGGLHTPQEWIELASLVERCQLLAVTMMRTAAAPLK